MQNNRFQEVRADALAGELVILVELEEVVFEEPKYILAAGRYITAGVSAVGVLHDFLFDRRE